MVEGDRGGANPRVMGVGSQWQEGEERAGDRIPKARKPGEIGNKCCNIVQFFAIDKAHRGKDHQGRQRQPGVKGMGSRKFRPSVPPSNICQVCG